MLLKLCEAFDKCRFEIMVVSLTGDGEIGQRLRALGIDVHASPGIGICGLITSLRRLYKLTSDFKPDVVQTWMYHADLLAGIIIRLAGHKNLVWGIRNSLISADMVGFRTALVIRLCALLSSRLPRAILSCSARAREIHTLAGYDATRMHVIPNGFDLGAFHPDTAAKCSVRRELLISDSAHLIGVVARFDRQKNHLGFLHAAASVANRFPETRFVLIGRGLDTENAAVVQLISELGLDEKVILLGERQDMPRLMAGLDLLASPSHGEAFPNVLGEAMASGVPCVVTDAGDSAEIIGDTGRLVAVGDMQGLANAIVELLAFSDVQRHDLGLRARARVQSCYNMKIIAERYQDFYKNLLSDGQLCAG
ncbi:MAG: glycosyltransferase [Rhodocyclaceae bacterium]|nr:MAG: glycosyltransferase [Rhodocyclaceae bacterium]